MAVDRPRDPPSQGVIRGAGWFVPVTEAGLHACGRSRPPADRQDAYGTQHHHAKSRSSAIHRTNLRRRTTSRRQVEVACVACSGANVVPRVKVAYYWFRERQETNRLSTVAGHVDA